VPSATAVSAQIPDWSRESKPTGGYSPALSLLSAIRGYQRCRGRGNPLARGLRAICVLRWRFWSAVCGADIPLSSHIAGGLVLPHPNGIVIHPDAVIGPNCMIFQQVTIGNGGPIAGCPHIGGHVDIGAGAKILGGVSIGDHARIGANAVVLTDIPGNATAVGIPARIIPPPNNAGGL